MESPSLPTASQSPASDSSSSLESALASAALPVRKHFHRPRFNQRALIISIVFHVLLLLAAGWAIKRFTSSHLTGVVGRRGGHVTAPGPPDADAIVDSYNQSAASLEPIDVLLPTAGRHVRMLEVDRAPKDFLPIPSPLPWPAADARDAASIASEIPYFPRFASRPAIPPQPATVHPPPIPAKVAPAAPGPSSGSSPAASQPAVAVAPVAAAPPAPAASQPSQSPAPALPAADQAMRDDPSKSGGGMMAAAKMDGSPSDDSTSSAAEQTSTSGVAAASGSSAEYAPPRPAGVNSRRGGRAAQTGYDSRGLPKPEYPLMAKQRNQEGLVELLVQVHVDGTPGRITVLSDAGYPLLANAAIEAVREASFFPATLGGSPVEGSLKIPFRFELK